MSRLRTLRRACGIAALTLPISAAAAQPVCLARAAVLQQLQTDFGESLLWQGRLAAEPGQESPLLEVFANPDGGSWTLVQSLPPSPQYPGGLSCFVAAGTRWTPPSAPVDGRKS